jgi:septal ring factor EnvC (AmiA/AmiB activator)
VSRTTPWVRCAVGVVLLFAAGAAAALQPDQELAGKERELQQLRARIAELRSELETARGERDDLADALAALERAIGRLVRQIHELTGEIEVQQQRLVELEDQRQARQRQLDVQRRALAAQLRAAHAMGRQERIKILLNQQDPELVSRMLVYYDYLNRARLRDIRDIRAGLEELQRLRREIGDQQRSLSESRRRRREEMQALDRNQQDRERLLADLEADIAARGHDLGALERDQEQLEAFLQQLQQVLDQLPLENVGDAPFRGLQGQLAWPVQGRLAVKFGSPRRPGSRRWDGVVIDAGEGSEVRAVHHGRVAFADWLRGMGLLLIIDHGNGYMTLYGQNQSLFKETGDWVAPGELVGLAGRSGGKATAGVYFGIRHQGKPVDPRAWCQPAKGGRVG